MSLYKVAKGPERSPARSFQVPDLAILVGGGPRVVDLTLISTSWYSIKGRPSWLRPITG